MPIERVLVVDDELLMRQFLTEALERKGYTVATADEGKQALALHKQSPFDLILTDMRLPTSNGLEVLRKAKEISPQTVVIVMTAFGTIENAVEAMQLGAFNYLLKPFALGALEALLIKANEHIALVQENLFLRQEVTSERMHTKLIAKSPLMKKILADAVKVASSQASILIHGESGTGKEVMAAAIHAHSPRARRPYIRINCAAIPDTLIESEFFGHEKGAFTGANTRRLGRFELADTGTLLLDEVTEIPLALQPKLLRVIQEQEFERVGGTRPLSVDVRLISTSNRNLKEAIEQKLFREDLFYRLNVVPLSLPPLRDRREDIVPLASYFLEQHCKRNHKALKQLTPKAKERLQNYPWPGNIRELSNLIERAVVLDYGPTINDEHFALS